MSFEFSPKAPQISAEDITETKIVKLDARIEGALLRLKQKAEARYTEALRIAEGVDDQEGTEQSPNLNAVIAAKLLTVGSVIRGTQIA